ncbi:unnamed protein product [Onchocerca flexuosa]|uniref:Uncharacterized protein n=1 Tax=Onchocerca flexuosa TaxID=387005 RepID=A0A183HE45_9BILA|nr:unnamed protein product [Onchocerca flexuosa]
MQFLITLNFSLISLIFHLFQCISELFSKLKAAEDASKPAFEKTANLQSEIDELKRQLAKKEADLEKCGNCYDEMRKAEQLIEQIRLERDEVRSTLNKIPTCVICLDKRVCSIFNFQ